MKRNLIDFTPLVSQVEGQVTPVNLPSSRGLSTPGSPATSVMVNTHAHVISVSAPTLNRCLCVCSG